MLPRLEKLVVNGSLGLYRDDGLAVVNGYSGPEMDRLRKKIIALFKENGFQITIEVNLTRTEFLDLMLDLENEKYYPYRKPNDTPLYVHRHSNHPQIILKQLPKMTAKRLSTLSCDEQEFSKAAREYEEVLKKSGFDEKLEFVQVQRTRRKKRDVIWFNPPFDLQVKGKIGKSFLSLLDKHFPPHHKLHSVINRNTVKISYCCMPNMASMIKQNNRKLLKKEEATDASPACNCRSPSDCPLEGNCIQESVVYNAKVTVEGKEVGDYIGVCEPAFKGRWSDHNSSFRQERYRAKTQLSQLVWKLKDEGKVPQVTWSILRKCSPYRAGSRHCDLCLWEKFYIINRDSGCINKKDELLGKCRHMNKFLLMNYKCRRKNKTR